MGNASSAIVRKDDTARVLIHLFASDAREDREVRAMVKMLAMSRSELQYHLDELKGAGLVDMESGKYVHGNNICWALTAEGRKEVVERRLLPKCARG